jgi:ABC-type multidrug transport system ATPase subunit
MKMKPLAIEISGLSKVFYQYRKIFRKEPIKALEDINLEIKQGEVFGLMGQNGAGKTTLIKIISTLITPTSGRVIINGYDIKEAEKIKSMIGLIYHDERSFYPRLTVRQNLEFIAVLYGLSGVKMRERIDKMLDLTGLQDKGDLWVQNLSAGTKQRLAIARGLLHDPDIVFMDEPTKGIDPWESKKFLQFTKEFLNKKLGKTIFLASHDLEQVQSLCDSAALMYKGKMALYMDSARIKEMGKGDMLGALGDHMKDAADYVR